MTRKKNARESISIPGILDDLNDLLGGKKEEEVTLKTAMDELANLFDMQAIKEKKKTQESFDAIWEFEPVGPEQFCKDEHYLGLGDQMYPVVMQDLIDCFPNPKELKPTYEEIIFDEAIGSGKCLSGDTEVFLANGNMMTIEEIYNSGKKVFELFSLNEQTGKLEKQFSNNVLCNGIKDVWKITTRCGREIKATDNHQFIINGKWKELKDIKVGEFIAVPAKIEVEGKEVLSDDIFWDKIEKIEYAGKEKVYDISMPVHHNFVANDIIVHNSFKLSILATYMAYKLLCLRNPQKTFNLAPASKLAIMNMSVSASQAKRVVFGEIKNKIDFSPWFQQHYPPNPRIRSELQFDPSPDVVKPGDKRIYKNVYIIPGSSSGFAPLGYNLFCGIIDEATLWRDSDNKDYVQEVYEIIRRRVTSRFMDKGLIVLGGSPMYSTDFLERRIKAVKDEGLKNVLVRRRSHWDAKYPDYKGPVFYFHLDDCKVFKTEEEMLKDRDKVAKRAGSNWETAIKEYDENIKKIPMMYYEDFKKNPEGSKRDLGGWPSDSVSAFISNPSIIQENINYTRKDPVKGPYQFKKWFGPVNPKAWHTIHIDLGITGDACGIAMGHPEGFTEEGGVNVFIDFVMRIEGSNENPVQIEDIRQMIYRLSAMGFPIGKITMDGFQSVDTMQILRKKGYYTEYLSLDRSMDAYEEWKTAYYEHRINMYEHPVYEQEARKLEKIKNKKIDHPRGGSKDLADAVAGVTYNCVELAKWDPPTDDDELSEVLSF